MVIWPFKRSGLFLLVTSNHKTSYVGFNHTLPSTLVVSAMLIVTIYFSVENSEYLDQFSPMHSSSSFQSQNELKHFSIPTMTHFCLKVMTQRSSVLLLLQNFSFSSELLAICFQLCQKFGLWFMSGPKSCEFDQPPIMVVRASMVHPDTNFYKASTNFIFMFNQMVP